MSTNTQDQNDQAYVPETNWSREGTLVYSLAFSGRYRKGEPLMENAVMVNVSGHRDHATPEQLERIADRIQQILNEEMPPQAASE